MARRHAWHNESSLRFAIGRQLNLMVSAYQVKSAEIASFRQAIERLINARQHVWISVLGFHVKTTIVNAHAPSPILLLN